MSEVTLGQGNQVLNLILQHNVSSKQAQELLASGLLSDLLQVKNAGSIDRTAFQNFLSILLDLTQVFTVSVNWDESLEEYAAELITRGFTHADLGIRTENCPNPDGKHGTTMEVMLFHGFGKTMVTEDVRTALDVKGLLACHPKIVCAWLLQNYHKLLSHMKRGLYLVMVNPMCNDRVVCLYCDGSARSLFLDDAGSQWRADWLFPASPQVS